MGGGNRALATVSVRNIGAHKLRLVRTFDSAVATRYAGGDAVVEPASEDGAVSAAEADVVAALPGTAGVNVIGTQVVVAATDSEEPFQTRQGSASVGVYYDPEESVGDAPALVEGEAPRANRGGEEIRETSVAKRSACCAPWAPTAVKCAS